MNSSALLEAMRALQKRDLLEGELSTTLERRGFTVAAIESAMTQLRHWGFLDDARVANHFAESFLRQRKGGPLKLQAHLVQRGMDQSEAEDLARALFDEQTQDELARTLIGRLKPKSPDKGYRQLLARGFDAEVADRALRGYFGDSLDS